MKRKVDHLQVPAMESNDLNFLEIFCLQIRQLHLKVGLEILSSVLSFYCSSLGNTIVVIPWGKNSYSQQKLENSNKKAMLLSSKILKLKSRTRKY